MDGQTIINLITGASFGLAVIGAVWGHFNTDRYGMWPVVSWVFVGVGLVVGALALVFAVLVPMTASYDETVCERYGQASEREVMFERYGFGSWDCLVETDEGWVSTSRITKVDD